MEIEDVMLAITNDSPAVRDAILRGLEGAYSYSGGPRPILPNSENTQKHDWKYEMSGEYSGNVYTVIVGIRAAVKPLLGESD